MAELPLDQAIPRFKSNEDRMDRFVNGGPAATWVTSGGTEVPSLRKFIADWDAQLAAAVGDMPQATIRGRALGAGTGPSAALNAGQVSAILGLKQGATRDVGTAAGTLAAGNDSRILLAANSVQKDAPVMSAPPVITSASVDQDGCIHLSRVNTFTNGIGNDQPAVQVALDNLGARGGGSLILPSGGTVRLDGYVYYTSDNPISIRSLGGRRGATIDQRVLTALSFVGSGPNSNLAVHLEGIRFIGNIGDGTAVGLYNVENIEMHKIRGVAGSGWWSAFLYGTGVRTSHFHDWYVRNDHGSNTYEDIRGIAVRLNAEGTGSTTNVFNGLVLQGFQQAFNFDASGSPGNEGIYINNCEIIQCAYGIVWRHTGGGGYVPPLLKFTNSHMNCFRMWGDFKSVAQVDISHNTLELNSVFGHADSGISFDQTVHYSVESNRMFFTNGNRNARAIIALYGSNIGDIHNNKMALPGALASIEIQSGAGLIDITNNAATGTGTMLNSGGFSVVSTNNRLF